MLSHTSSLQTLAGRYHASQFLHCKPRADPVTGETPKGGRVPAQSSSPQASTRDDPSDGTQFLLHRGNTFRLAAPCPRLGGGDPPSTLSQPSRGNPTSSRQGREERDMVETGHQDAIEHLLDQHLPGCALFPGRDLGKGDAIPYFRGTRRSVLGMGSCTGRHSFCAPIAQTQPGCSTASASTLQLTCLLLHKPKTTLQQCHGASPARAKPS